MRHTQSVSESHLSSPAEPAPAPPTKGAAQLPWHTEVLLLLVVALALRALKIAVTEPWLDEACSIERARHGPAALLHTLTTSDASPHPPLYFLLLSGFIHLLGDTIGPVRLPSLFAGLALVATTAEAARRLAGRWPARLAGLIAAVSPLAIHYSVEARSYGLLAVLSLGLALSVERFLATGERRSLLLVGILGLTASLTHYFALFLLPLPLLLALGDELSRRRHATTLPQDAPNPVRGAVIASAVLLAAMLPGIWLVIGQLQRGAGGTSWLRPMTGMFDASVASLEAMALGTKLPIYLGHAGMVRVGELMHALGLGFMGGGALLGTLWPLPPERRGIRRALVGLALLSAGAPLVLSVWRPLYLPGRYELAAMAPVHVLAAVGWWHMIGLLAARLQRKDQIAGWLVGLAVVILSSGYLPQYLGLRTVQPFTLVNMSITRAATPTSAVIFTRLTGPPTAWQLRQTDFPGITRYFPAAQASHPCWLDKAVHADPKLADEAAALSADLSRAGIDRLFVVVALRKGRPYRPTSILFKALKASGWKMRGSRHAGVYGIAMFARKR